MKKYQAIAVGLASAFATQLSFAQSTTSQQEQNGSLQSQSSISSDKEHTSSGSSLGSSSNSAMQSGPIRASKLIGSNVTGKDGTNLGQVHDLVMNPRTGKIRFALVGHEFMAGAGETFYPIPWKAVNVHSENQFVLNVDQQKLKSAPAWSETEIEQPDYVLHVFRFYDVEPDTAMGGPGESQEQSGKGHGTSSQSTSQGDQSKPEQSSTPSK